MTTNTELLPCPFCGGAANNVSGNYTRPSYYWYAGDEIFAVDCGSCGASVPNMLSNERVVAKWNRRAALSAAPDAAPSPKFDQAEFDEMVRRGTAAWAGIDTNNIYGDAQPEQDRLDAARYRWLRDVGDSTYTAFANHPGYDAMQADRHIDAAIAQAKEGKT